MKCITRKRDIKLKWKFKWQYYKSDTSLLAAAALIGIQMDHIYSLASCMNCL